ncbi:MAG TPA: YigZ family protein [Candidatus Limadaptatus stercoravium]|nr:YigZ family protein [Candidatus Limadaptatus stercoravium]
MSKFYLTVDGVTENTVEIKRSKFIATLSHVESGEDAEAFVRAVRKRYPDATHNCYAYIADELGNETRFSDDGEPGGTAGQPMLEVLRKKGIVKAAVVVTRYFGGIKLGAGGLVAAYTDSVSEVLDAAGIRRMTECAEVTVECDYSDHSAIESALTRAGALRGEAVYGENVRAVWYAETDKSGELLELVSAKTLGKVRAEITGRCYKAL